MSPYAIHVDLEIFNHHFPEKIEDIKAFISCMQNSMSKAGWQFSTEESSQELKFRFWLADSQIDEEVQLQLNKRLSSIRGKLTKFISNMFNGEVNAQVMYLSTNILKEKIEKSLEKNIESQLEQLSDLEGFTITKGNQPLFETIPATKKSPLMN